MKEPDEVAAMLRLKAIGWGIKRISWETRVCSAGGGCCGIFRLTHMHSLSFVEAGRVQQLK